jgi:hypothetical protein
METNDDDREDQDLSEVVGRVGKGGGDGHGGRTVEGEHLVIEREKSALFKEGRKRREKLPCACARWDGPSFGWGVR